MDLLGVQIRLNDLSGFGRLDLGVTAGLLDRVGHLDLALGIATKSDILERSTIFGTDRHSSAQSKVGRGDTVTYGTKIIPHSCFRTNGYRVVLILAKTAVDSSDNIFHHFQSLSFGCG